VDLPFGYVGSCVIIWSLHRTVGLPPFFTRCYGAFFWTSGVLLFLKRIWLLNVDLILLIGPSSNFLAFGFKPVCLLLGLVILLVGPRKVNLLASFVSLLLFSFCSSSLHLSSLWLGGYFVSFNTMVSICYQKIK